MSLVDLIRGKPKDGSGAIATLTVATSATVAWPATSGVATVASVTVASPEKYETTATLASMWHLHFTSRDPITVAFSPAVDHAGALAAYPTANAAEPATVPPAARVPAETEALFDACERVGLYGTEDRAALPALIAIDPEGTRGLIEAMHSRIGRCRRCQHFRRPGLSAGYCIRRDDLLPAYGLLRQLPDDGGALCREFVDAF